MTHTHDTLAELADQGRKLRQTIPEVYAAYSGMRRAVMTEGALSVKTKELIALAIAVTRECDGCIASHGRAVAKAGATEAEVAEAMGVAILLNGGPGTVWGPRAFAAARESMNEDPPAAV